MAVRGSFAKPQREGLAHAASLLAQRMILDRFFLASKEGSYEAVRILVEELKRKSLPSPFVLHVTLSQTMVTTVKTFRLTDY